MGLRERQYDDFVFGLKYRPKTIDDIVMPKRLRNLFNNMVESGNIGSLLLSGQQGCGKSTIAFCLSKQCDLETYYMRMSRDTSIDNIRNEFIQFVSTVSNNEKKKLFIGDEFDRISNQAMDALKTEIEMFQNNCNFIFITNHKNKISKTLMSRLDEIDFVFKQSEKLDMKKQLAKSLVNILNEEGIKFEKEALKIIINKNFPDMRKTVNLLNLIARQNNNKITVKNINDNFVSNSDIVKFYRLISEKDFGGIRTLISGLSIDHSSFYSTMFSTIHNFIKPENLPEAVLIIDEYQSKSVFVPDTQIPLTACAIRLMVECEWEVGKV